MKNIRAFPRLKVRWLRYADFFRLYDKKATTPRLIYVIGERRFCYIGSVGGKGGENGLARRYEKQYVDRSKAIFGKAQPQNQPAFAGEIINSPGRIRDLLLSAERLVQREFLKRCGSSNALFTPRGKPMAMELLNTGKRPSFLRRKLVHNPQLQRTRGRRAAGR